MRLTALSNSQRSIFSPLTRASTSGIWGGIGLGATGVPGTPGGRVLAAGAAAVAGAVAVAGGMAVAVAGAGVGFGASAFLQETDDSASGATTASIKTYFMNNPS